MITEMIMRSPKTQRAYSRYQYRNERYGKGCAFCDIAKHGGEQKTAETTYCLVIANLFGYRYWDDCQVTEHIMIIPKRHVASLAELTEAERLDYINLAAQYEADGYSLYARSPSNAVKSVDHQHTHLIKIDNRSCNFMIYLKKPHIVWSR